MSNNNATVTQLVAALLPDNDQQQIKAENVRNAFAQLIESYLNNAETATQQIAGLTDFNTGVMVDSRNIWGSRIHFVNVLADLPTQVAGTITTVANINYVVSSNIVNPYEMQITPGSIISGHAAGQDSYEYSGTGTAFKGTDTGFTFNSLSIVLSGNGSKLLDVIDATGYAVVNFTNTRVTATGIGCSLGNMVSGNFLGASSSLFMGFDNPFDLSGTFSRFDFTRCAFVNGGNIFNFDASLVISNAGLENCTFDNTGSGDIVLVDNGATISNRINISDCGLTGLGTFGGATEFDKNKDYNLTDNSGLNNTVVTGSGSIQDNATNTTFSGTGAGNEVAVDFGTAFVAADQLHVSVSNTGVFTVNSKEKQAYTVDVTLFAEVTGGASRDYVYLLAVNGAVQEHTKTKARYDGSNPGSSSVAGNLILDTGDVVTLVVRAETATTALTVDTCSIYIALASH